MVLTPAITRTNVWFLAFVAAAAASVARSGEVGSGRAVVNDAELQRWVANLDSDQFAARETATRKLISARGRSIPPVVSALSRSRNEGKEVIVRGIYILQELAICGERTTEEAAQAALAHIAAGGSSAAARRAAASLEALGQIRQRRAIRALELLGAEIQVAPGRFAAPMGTQVAYSIQIDEQWKGNEGHLDHLTSLVDLQKVTFRGPQVRDAWLERIRSLPKVSSVTIAKASISNEGVAHLAGMSSLQRLYVLYTPISDGAIAKLAQLERAQLLLLYGTQITPDGAVTLKSKLAPAVVDVKNGAFLGVGPTQLGGPCMIGTVRAGTSAERADLRLGDIIKRYNGKAVDDFDGLRVLIGENRAGDDVEVVIQRGEELLTKRIRLGEWDIDQLNN